MRNREEQRAGILEGLKDFRKSQWTEVEEARLYVEGIEQGKWIGNDIAYENCKKLIKYGKYTPIVWLRERVRGEMEIKPVKVDIVKERLPLWGGGYRTYTYHYPTYSAEDEQKVSTVIERMAAQGFIRISKSGKAFKVLRTE